MQETINEKMSGIDIDLQGLLRAYLHKWWLILICLVLGASIALGITYQFVTPMYQARISIYVNNNKSSEDKEYLSSADLSASQRLVNTYVSIAKSERVLEKISENLNGEYSVNGRDYLAVGGNGAVLLTVGQLDLRLGVRVRVDLERRDFHITPRS